MALIVIGSNRSDWPERSRYYADEGEVQRKFCDLMEYEGDAIFQDPEVKEYLENFGVRYKGHYTLESEDWHGEMFMTYLNYPLQLACLALYDKRLNVIISGQRFAYDIEWLLPVLKKRDLYLVSEDYEEWTCYDDAARSGVEVRIAGRSSAEMSEREFTLFLMDLDLRTHHLSKEVDAKVFPEDFREKYLFEPTQVTLADYLRGYGEGETEEDAVRDVAHAPDIRVLVNGKNNFDGLYRKYPIHILFYMEGKWRYAEELSVKNPTLGELLENAVFCDEVMNSRGDGWISVSAAEKVFALVLDCDERCDVRKYWETVAFVAKYDKAGGVLEICDINRGVLEFHELLQQSEDLDSPE